MHESQDRKVILAGSWREAADYMWHHGLNTLEQTVVVRERDVTKLMAMELAEDDVVEVGSFLTDYSPEASRIRAKVRVRVRR